LVLATASLDVYVEPFSRILGFDHTVCTKVAWTNDGRLDGRLMGGNCYGNSKLASVNALMVDQNLPAITIAYSDHYDDLPLLKAAKCGVIVSPTKRLAKCAGDLGLRCEVW
jgi:phosphoserine phosphatase